VDDKQIGLEIPSSNSMYDAFFTTQSARPNSPLQQDNKEEEKKRTSQQEEIQKKLEIHQETENLLKELGFLFISNFFLFFPFSFSKKKNKKKTKNC